MVREREVQGVNDGVAGDVDYRRVDPLAEQVRPARGGGGEVDRGEVAGEDPVLLLGERVARAPRSEPRFDVGKRNLLIVTRERRGQDGRRIPLPENQ